MAIEIMNEVWQHAPERGLELTVLLALADNADAATRIAWPGEVYLAYKCRCSERSVRRIVAVLEGAKAITIRRREGKSNVYTVLPQQDRKGALTGWVNPNTPAKLSGVTAPTPDKPGTDPGHGCPGTPDIAVSGEPSRTVKRTATHARAREGETSRKPEDSPKWLIDLFYQAHLQRLGTKYLVREKRDGKLAKEAMRLYPKQQIQAALTAYFADPRHYTIGASLSLFVPKIPVLLTAGHRAVGARLERESSARREEQAEAAQRRPSMPREKREQLSELVKDLALRRIGPAEYNRRLAELDVPSPPVAGECL